MGISVDSPHTLREWAQRRLGGVPFPLCADNCPHGAVSKLYGLYNETGCRNERTVIVVDKQGIIRFVDVHKIAEVPDPEMSLGALRNL